jgi:hypothetical protein
MAPPIWRHLKTRISSTEESGRSIDGRPGGSVWSSAISRPGSGSERETVLFVGLAAIGGGIQSLA